MDVKRWEAEFLYRKINGDDCNDCEALGGPLPAIVVLSDDYDALALRCDELTKAAHDALDVCALIERHVEFMTDKDAMDIYKKIEQIEAVIGQRSPPTTDGKP